MPSDRWRYHVVEIKPNSMWKAIIPTADLQSELDRQGSQGWELVLTVPGTTAMGGLRLVFKRPA
ncbi:MAG: DUF4177 domain-containing protein [Pseudomonadota bacterium]|jgi:hypothetical protein